jgi:hypothetical protein
MAAILAFTTDMRKTKAKLLIPAQIFLRWSVPGAAYLQAKTRGGIAGWVENILRAGTKTRQ